MTEPRKSTVYDYSDLRLHPDGTRVYQKSTNLRPKLAQRTVQDARSNWIAQDAGGPVKVPLFKRKKDRVEEEEKDANFSASASPGREGSSGEVDDDVGEHGKRRARRPDHRKAKRQKFLKNDDFLAGNSTHNLAGPSDMSSSSLPHPSPDLLKCIHRFASEFYTERGQLLNTTRQYRKERKERRVKRAVDRGSSPSSLSTSSSESQSKSADGYGARPEDDVSEGSDVAVRTTQRKGRKGRRRSEKLYVDMYKVFDGSAMMALGVLVQEHIAHLLKPSIPDSWEREIRSAYTDPWGDCPQIEKDGVEVRQDSAEDGKEDVDNVAGTDNEQRIEGLKLSGVDMEGDLAHNWGSGLEHEHDGGTSKDDASSWSEDS